MDATVTNAMNATNATGKKTAENLIPKQNNKKKTLPTKQKDLGTTTTVLNTRNKKKNTGKKTDKTASSTTSTQTATDNNVTRKGKTGEIPDYSDDDSSINDGVDYSKPGNYAVKKFIGYKEFMKGGIKLSYIPGGKDGEMQNL